MVSRCEQRGEGEGREGERGRGTLREVVEDLRVFRGSGSAKTSLFLLRFCSEDEDERNVSKSEKKGNI